MRYAASGLTCSCGGAGSHEGCVIGPNRQNDQTGNDETCRSTAVEDPFSDGGTQRYARGHLVAHQHGLDRLSRYGAPREISSSFSAYHCQNGASDTRAAV